MSAPSSDTLEQPQRAHPIKVFVRPSDFATTAEAAKAIYDAFLEAYPELRRAQEQQRHDDADPPKESPDARPDVGE